MYGLVIGLGLLLSSSAQAQDKPQLVEATFRDFTGGLVDSVEPMYLQPNQSPDLQNVIIDDPKFALKPRNGFKYVVSLPSGNPATILYEFLAANGNKYLIASDNQNIYATTDLVTWETIKSGISAGITPSFSSVRGKLWTAAGSTWTFTWDNTTTVLLSGVGSTPNPAPPICRYLEFYKERVFCARTSGYPSGVQWSALDDSVGNDLDPSTGTLSWPATNIINVNQDDGNPILGLKSYRGRLYAFKVNGIYLIEFNNDFDNGVLRVSPVGVKYNTAIWELDNLLYFIGVDGIYAFDGEQAIRISDDISNKFNSINQLSASERFHQWTSQGDWLDGTFSSTTANDITGSVTSSSYTVIPLNGDFETGDTTGWTSVVTQGAVCGPPTGTNSFTVVGGSVLGGTYSGQILSNKTYNTGSPLYKCLSGSTSLTYILKDGANSVIKGPITVVNGFNNVSLSGLTTTYMSILLNGNPYSFGSVTAESSKFDVGKSTGITFYASITDDGASSNYKFDLSLNNVYFTTGVFTSDVYNMVSVSSHSIFDVEYILNGGNIDLSYRTGSNSLDISTAAYKGINPGSFVSSYSSHTLFQFQSTFTVSNNNISPEMLSATINWYQGSANLQPIHMRDWSNRLWITASTGVATSNNMALVKSRYPSSSFVPYSMGIGAITKLNDLFYAGSSTCSSIYRMDYGANDDNIAIDWYWTSRDEVWGSPWLNKQLYEISSDFRKNNATNAYVGYSTNGGVSYTEKPVIMSGSGRSTDRRFVGSGKSQAYRFKIGDRAKDEKATILGVSGWAFPEKLRQ